MKNWFKMHEGTIEDTRLAFIAKRLSVKRTAVQAAWWLALDMASQAEIRGSFAPDGNAAEVMAFVLDESVEDVERIVAAFNERGMVQDGIIADWVKIQSMSTAGAARMAKYRERNKKASQDLKSDAHGDKKNVTGDGKNVTSDAKQPLKEQEDNITPLTPQGDGEGEDHFLEFWKERAGRGNAPDNALEARREWEKLVEAGTDAAKLQNALRGYAAWCRAAGKDGTQFVKSTAAFLRDGLWQQYAETPAAAAPDNGADLPEWQQGLCRVMQPVEVRNWFKGADFDGKAIIVRSKAAAEYIKKHFSAAIQQVLGSVEIQQGETANG